VQVLLDCTCQAPLGCGGDASKLQAGFRATSCPCLLSPSTLRVRRHPRQREPLGNIREVAYCASSWLDMLFEIISPAFPDAPLRGPRAGQSLPPPLQWTCIAPWTCPYGGPRHRRRWHRWHAYLELWRYSPVRCSAPPASAQRTKGLLYLNSCCRAVKP
jgi:hypothetical protein